MHLDGSHLCSQIARGERDDHSRLQDTSLDTSNRHSTDASNLVDVLERQSKRFVEWSMRWLDGVERLQQRLSGHGRLAAFDRPTLEPGHVARLLEHVVTGPARDRHERDLGRVPADLAREQAHLALDLLVALLAVWRIACVHLREINFYFVFRYTSAFSKIPESGNNTKKNAK